MADSPVDQGAVVCIPTYNERENIERIVPAVLEQVPDANVLVIDDNSPDQTGKLADSIAKEDSRVHVLHRAGKEGLGRAYLAAFEWALSKKYKYIIEFDADFSHNPQYLPIMLSHLERNDVVVGSRRVPGGGVENWSLPRRIISGGGSLYARTVLGVPVKDLTGGFNGFRASTLETIDYQSIGAAGYTFQIEIKYRYVKAGLRLFEMPIIFPDRKHGTSKMSSSIFAEAMLAVWKLRLGL
jgi:dolichol-phosphate mannosyltransferase